jgi:hypothetical protein
MRESAFEHDHPLGAVPLKLATRFLEEWQLRVSLDGPTRRAACPHFAGSLQNAALPSPALRPSRQPTKSLRDSGDGAWLRRMNDVGDRRQRCIGPVLRIEVSSTSSKTSLRQRII